MENTKEIALDKRRFMEILDENSEWYRDITESVLDFVGIYQYRENEGIQPFSVRDISVKSNQLVDVIFQDDYPQLVEVVSGAFALQSDFEISLRYYSSTGKPGWLQVRGHWLEEEVPCFFVVGTDISIQKEVENDLFLQQQKYRILEETTEEVLFEYKVVENEMSYSRKELNGMTKKKVIPFYMQSLENSETVHPDYRNVVEEHFRKAICKPCRDEYEYLSRISGNGYEWHRMVYVSVEDSYGRISSIVGRIRNIHDEVLERRILNTKANVDQMTHLFNKSYIKDTINAHLLYSSAEDSHILVMIGIDRFNRIIEQNGHACGDMVVQRVSKLLQDTVASMAILGRQGNENFLAYVENGKVENLDACIESFLIELHKTENKIAEVEIACSIGAAVSKGVTDFDELYEKVDEALYLAKITKDTHYVRV